MIIIYSAKLRLVSRRFRIGQDTGILPKIKDLLIDTYVADAVVILGSLDIVLGEVDR